MKKKFVPKAKQALEHKKRTFVKRYSKHFVKYSIIFLVIYFLILYLIFFIFINTVSRNNYNAIDNTILIYDISDIREISQLETYLDNDTGSKPIQPVNIIIATDKDIRELFYSIDWVDDITFNKDNITLHQYYVSFKNKTLPVTDLYLNGRTQDYSFQNKSSSNRHREHIRLWEYAHLSDNKTIIYLGTISIDDGFTLSLYSDFLVPIHDIDPNIDLSRDLLLSNFLQKYPQMNYYNLSWMNKISEYEYDDNNLNYYTNGKIFFMEFNS